MIVIDVYGEPAPKGSVRAFVRGGRAVVSAFGSGPQEKRIRAWEAAVRAHARAELVGRAPFAGVALRVALTFYLQRPAGHFGTGRNRGKLKASSPARPLVKPDADKLARSTLDALTAIAWDDDARVVDLAIAKYYTEGDGAGVNILIDEAT